MLNEEDHQQMLNEAYKLLLRLGVSPRYRGYHHAAYSIFLCAQQPDWMFLTTKYVYPEVAKHFHTTWQSVERNIRTVVGVCWKTNPALICELCSYKLTHKPCAKEFIAILSTYLRLNNAV